MPTTDTSESDAHEGRAGRHWYAWFGTYTKQRSRGIYVAPFDSETGRFDVPQLAVEAADPSFLAVHPARPLLYAVSESTNHAIAFAILPDARLREINSQPTGGDGPAHLILDRRGEHLLIANYGGGSVACLPIRADGGIEPPSSVQRHSGSSVNEQRQNEPHAHGLALDANERFALCADLGIDQIVVYRYSSGRLTRSEPPAKVAPGSGPRHLAFHPSGRYVYLINELSSTVTCYAYDPERGGLAEMQTVSLLPPGFTEASTAAEIAIHPNGQWLYASNRGHDSIAAFRIDPDDGKLVPLGHQSTQGREPRHFAIDPTGCWIIACNHKSHSVVVLPIESDGMLKPGMRSIELDSPVCVQWSPRPAAGSAAL